MFKYLLAVWYYERHETMLSLSFPVEDSYERSEHNECAHSTAPGLRTNGQGQQHSTINSRNRITCGPIYIWQRNVKFPAPKMASGPLHEPC